MSSLNLLVIKSSFPYYIIDDDSQQWLSNLKIPYKIVLFYFPSEREDWEMFSRELYSNFNKRKYRSKELYCIVYVVHPTCQDCDVAAKFFELNRFPACVSISFQSFKEYLCLDERKIENPYVFNKIEYHAHYFQLKDSKNLESRKRSIDTICNRVFDFFLYLKGKKKPAFQIKEIVEERYKELLIKKAPKPNITKIIVFLSCIENLPEVEKEIFTIVRQMANRLHQITITVKNPILSTDFESTRQKFKLITFPLVIFIRISDNKVLLKIERKDLEKLRTDGRNVFELMSQIHYAIIADKTQEEVNQILSQYSSDIKVSDTKEVKLIEILAFLEKIDDKQNIIIYLQKGYRFLKARLSKSIKKLDLLQEEINKKGKNLVITKKDKLLLEDLKKILKYFERLKEVEELELLMRKRKPRVIRKVQKWLDDNPEIYVLLKNIESTASFISRVYSMISPLKKIIGV